MNRGLTMLELLLVVAVLVALATSVFPRLTDVGEEARARATLESMRAIRNAIRGTDADPGYRGTVGKCPSKIDDLFKNNTGAGVYSALTRKGFRPGGYVQSNGALYRVDTAHGFSADYCYADGMDNAVMDGWNRPIVLQINPLNSEHLRLVSAGADGFLETGAGNTSAIGDDLVQNLYEGTTPW